MTLTMDEARIRVARGAALLDRIAPGWADRIDEGLLHMANGCYCVLGQVFTDYGRGLHRCGRWGAYTGIVPVYAPQVQHGFTLEGYPGNYDGAWDTLQDAWIEAIADRKVPRAVPVPAPIGGRA